MRSMSQCFNIVYLAGGFTHALNDVLHAAERERFCFGTLALNASLTIHCNTRGAGGTRSRSLLVPVMTTTEAVEHAMQHATVASVLGNFDDASFDYFGVQSRFLKKDNKFFVETDGPDGKLAAFEVKYTFGIDPLQQYLIEFPDGRIQALSIAWDSRPKGQGGQRWFHLYPNQEIKHDDVLHWTKLNQNWNFMCAECHSTGVQKNYDAANDRFHTTWAEISVGCEACHGKGSRHVNWAQSQRSWFGKDEDPRKGLLVFLNERDSVTWQLDPKTGNPQRSVAPAITRREVETCGLCHARRGEFSETPTLFRPSLADSITPTGRCLMRSTITGRSSRARCSRPELPAAIATNPIVPNHVLQSTAFACNATPPTNMKLLPTMATVAYRRQ